LGCRRGRNDRHKLKFELAGPARSGRYANGRRPAFAASALAERFEDIVFVALGDSNLTAKIVLIVRLEKRWKRVFLLDTTDPASVAAISTDLDLQRTIFVFANKAQGISSPGRHFVAVTEQGSYLAEMAQTYEFRGLSLDPPGIKGQYSALIHLVCCSPRFIVSISLMCSRLQSQCMICAGLSRHPRRILR
jgi:glucose-6-phosphate isomerase